MDNRLQTEFLKQVREHGNIINKICFIYCSNKSDRDDLHQEIILQLWKSFPSFSNRSAFSTWMYRVALNTAISFTRKPSFIITARDLPEVVSDDEWMSDHSEDIKLLHKAIARLGRIDKALIILWLEDRSYEEIAATLGISVKNVSVKLVRTKARLAEFMKGML